ncbi:oxidoreductase [Aureococcus anophagefferens]|nr:oxidoreductase [Aureococcus anophagefferens]
MKDFAKPNVEDTIPYREASTLSDRFPNELYAPAPQKKKVAIIGGGLSGLPRVVPERRGPRADGHEARDVLGGKVSAWQDADGDWIETGLHIFFGAYPNMMRLFYELASRTGSSGRRAPLPMLIEGQDFINAQDELSVLDFMRKYGMPDRINDEVFISMAKALTLSTDKLPTGSAPMVESVEKKGGRVVTGAPLDRIEVDAAGNVDKLVLRSGEEVVADEYVSAMPVDVLKRMVPEAWSTMPYFKQLDELEGIPVINLHLWFDEKLTTIDHLCSRSPPVRFHADMSTTCPDLSMAKTPAEALEADDGEEATSAKPPARARRRRLS